MRTLALLVSAIALSASAASGAQVVGATAASPTSAPVGVGTVVTVTSANKIGRAHV